MEKYIRYKRINEEIEESEIQNFLDDLSSDGWDILYYKEKNISKNPLIQKLKIAVVVGKRQDDELIKQVL